MRADFGTEPLLRGQAFGPTAGPGAAPADTARDAAATGRGFEGAFATDTVTPPRPRLEVPAPRFAVAPACGGEQPASTVDGALAPDERYFTNAEMEAWMDDLAKAHPARARKLDLSTLPGAAKTHRGRSMFALEISADVAGQADKPAIVLAAQHHARELNSPVMALFAMKRLLEAYGKDPALTKLLDTHRIVIVPCVNPDGVDRVWNGQPMWRKNGRDNGDGTQGVDLNRNYPFLWARCGSSPQTGSEIYRGPSAGSEPETRTMMALQRWLRPELYLDVHSSGQEVLNLYPDCAQVKPAMLAFGARYAEDLRQQIGFGNRPPSGSGEAPHYFWSQGSLSYLIEIGQEFQPPFPDTVKEENLVWKALRHAMTAWAPAARGHVRSADGAALAAEVTVTPQVLAEGEKSFSRAADGRYGLWLPQGTYQVTFSAPGHESVTKTLEVTGYDQPQTLEVTLQKKARTPLLSMGERVQLRRAA